jgi:hypothetical protein
MLVARDSMFWLQESCLYMWLVAGLAFSQVHAAGWLQE